MASEKEQNGKFSFEKLIISKLSYTITFTFSGHFLTFRNIYKKDLYLIKFHYCELLVEFLDYQFSASLFSDSCIFAFVLILVLIFCWGLVADLNVWLTFILQMKSVFSYKISYKFLSTPQNLLQYFQILSWIQTVLTCYYVGGYFQK